MTKEPYKKEDITAYLLGALPESETEYFDELTFTDDSFADSLKLAEKDLVDSYVNGELSGANLERFKSYYLASPIRREKVEFAQAFQSFAESELEKEKVETIQNKKVGFFSRIFTIPRLSMQWGFALATLFLMIFGGWLFWENAELRSRSIEDQAQRDAILQRERELQQREKQIQDEIANQRTADAEKENELAKIREEREELKQELKKEKEQKRANEQREIEPQRPETAKTSTTPNPQISVASFILTPALRGTNELKILTIPTKTTVVAIQLQIESNDFKDYQVVLQNQSGQNVWQRGKIKSKNQGTNKVLNLSFPAKLLKSQIYSFEVSGINPKGGAEIISNYPFSAVIK